MNNPLIAFTKASILVMQAFAEGKTIQYRGKDGYPDKWTDMDSPSWDWYRNEYRIKPEPPKEVWVNHYDDGTKYSTKQAFDHKADADAFRATRTQIAGKAVLYREVVAE